MLRVAHDWWLKSLSSPVRRRLERPPTVFDWLILHWLSRRAAFTHELGDGHKHVEHLCRGDELGRVEEDLLDAHAAASSRLS